MGYLLYENKGFTSAMMNSGDVLQLNECLQCHLMLNTFILTWEGTTMAEKFTHFSFPSFSGGNRQQSHSKLSLARFVITLPMYFDLLVRKLSIKHFT
jgi:hypothetical protein